MHISCKHRQQNKRRAPTVVCPTGIKSNVSAILYYILGKECTQYGSNMNLSELDWPVQLIPSRISNETSISQLSQVQRHRSGEARSINQTLHARNTSMVNGITWWNTCYSKSFANLSLVWLYNCLYVLKIMLSYLAPGALLYLSQFHDIDISEWRWVCNSCSNPVDKMRLILCHWHHEPTRPR